MAEDYFSLSHDDKREALAVASSQSGRPIHLLEKDVWVVWTLRELFASPFGEHLVFKGGTSLSKAYHAIERFSEDVDITYDIRAIASDLVANAPDAIPPTRSQQNKWTEEIRKRLDTWVAETMLPYLQKRLASIDKDASATAKSEKIIIAYRPVATGTGYVGPEVRIDFGARSTGEPFELRKIVADAAAHLPDVTFAECEARTMRAERTFWEKATAIHVYCLQGELGGDRFSRHWSDLVELDDAGIASRALADRDLAMKVAEHKSMFFREKNTMGEVIDYKAAVSGALKLVPEGEARSLLAADYAKMLEDGLLPTKAKSFEDILARCADIEKRANASQGG
jgi:hypothetical protein